MNNIAKIVLGATALVFLSGFLVRGYFITKPAVIAPAIDPVMLQEANTWNKHVVDSAVSLLRSGYIVIRRGLGADSYMLAEMNRRDKTYSHCGIVMIEHGYPFVYHSIGGEDNPDERLRRDSAGFFFSPLHNTHIAIVRYDFDSAKINELRKIVVQYYKERPLFDMKFDLQTDDKLYCSEFIYKAVNKAMHDTAYIKSSTVLGRKFVGIDNLFMNDHAAWVWQVRFK